MRHPVDLGSVAVLRFGPDHVRFFTDGWGDEDLLTPVDVTQVPVEPLAIRWLTSTTDAGVVIRHGTFTSPFELLPDRARQGSVVAVEPDTGWNRTVVLMPAWNEHEPHVRMALARRLSRHGISSIILENAYFGSRHPDPHGGHPIRTVSDFMLMGASAVIEARNILAAVRDQGMLVGVSGYSMGGNTAALVAASMPFPVAAAPLAAAYSPAPVFLGGVLRHGIAWDALGGTDQADRLGEVLGRVSVLSVPPPAHAANAIIVGARSDAYIPRATTDELADHWPGCELRWERGGHATLVWLRKDRLADAVIDAFDRQYPDAPLPI
jgi:hypothetical protein